MKNVMGPVAWSHHEERLACLRGVVDVGVGQGAVRATGLTGGELSWRIGQLYHLVPDGGASVATAPGPDGPVRLYLRRRGKSLDAGTRADFAELGWAPLCDLLDAQFPAAPTRPGEDTGP